MPLPSYVSSMKLRVSSGTPPNVVIREQTITAANLGSNSIQITDPQMINDFNTKPSGTIFTPSIVVSYQDGGSGYSLANNSVSNYVPKQIVPNLSLAALAKLTTDASFNLTPLVSTGGSSGAMTFTSSNTSVATVSGSIVTIVGAGTATINVSLAESPDKVYLPVTTSATLTVTVPQWIQRGRDIDGEAAYNYSGRSLSISADGTIVAIGAINNSGVNGNNSGHVRVYKYDTNTNSWSQLGGDIDGEAANDQSGR